MRGAHRRGRASAPVATSRAWRAAATAAVGDADRRGVHRQRLNQRATAGGCTRCRSRRSPRCPGAAAGAGLSLALACDLRYAGRAAVMTTAFAKVGFSGDYGGTWFLTRLVGSGQGPRALLLLRPGQRRGGAAARHRQRGLSRPTSSPQDAPRSPARLAAGPDRGLPLHEGEPQPRRARRARRVPRPGGDAPHPHRADRGPPGGGQGVRREARAGFQGSMTGAMGRIGVAISGGPNPAEIVDLVSSWPKVFGHRIGLGGRGAWRRPVRGPGGLWRRPRDPARHSISSVFVRTAPMIAMAAATVDELTGGRFILGLGSSHKVQVEAEHGMAYGEPRPASGKR